ncbi:deoxyuridine 5'-triphosphate nucleotidohydrolase, mitochondrial-like [Trichosurus vulpecula]|uniref:deoxyuridine 5'-triphosphate nucleotidohydrolase, mitochondrial-like n=1 Tax=Trichosurus vulpecula TaxID=9337 RepID=UPI00186ACB33|nr:deoxyuridine 5'-triphosphate nucleotidohydrolase, mitochondrial-like [Trichosurus vulpecula]
MPCSKATPDTTSPSKWARPAQHEEESPMCLHFARLSEHAMAHSKGLAPAAGHDLYSACDYTPAMEKALVRTDIQISLPPGCYGRVAPHSGSAAKHFIDVGADVIDEDYRGNVGVVLFNFGKETFKLKKGNRIAQLICERVFYPELEEVQGLDDTEHGAGGFGSTGQN